MSSGGEQWDPSRVPQTENLVDLSGNPAITLPQIRVEKATVAEIVPTNSSTSALASLLEASPMNMAPGGYAYNNNYLPPQSYGQGSNYGSEHLLSIAVPMGGRGTPPSNVNVAAPQVVPSAYYPPPPQNVQQHHQQPYYGGNVLASGPVPNSISNPLAIFIPRPTTTAVQQPPQRAVPQDTYEEDFSEKLIAYSRYNRNNTLVQEIFSDLILPEPTVPSSSRLETLKAQAAILKNYCAKTSKEVEDIESKCRKRKLDLLESTVKFRTTYQSLCRPAVGAKVYAEMFLKHYTQMKKQEVAKKLKESTENSAETRSSEQESHPAPAVEVSSNENESQRPPISNGNSTSLVNVDFADILGNARDESDETAKDDSVSSSEADTTTETS